MPTYNAGTLEVRWADLSNALGQPSLHAEFQASQRSMVGPFFKIMKRGLRNNGKEKKQAINENSKH